MVALHGALVVVHAIGDHLPVDAGIRCGRWMCIVSRHGDDSAEPNRQLGAVEVESVDDESGVTHRGSLSPSGGNGG